mmetsp:Transcript_29343/g.47373  ORF Transcript_29343/g.47373 Transcript_29343/m.47373 type:complete len:507 (-) Transcript_29343:164-1684(-)
MRPTLMTESFSTLCATVLSESEIELQGNGSKDAVKRYDFDRVFAPHESQVAVFSETQPLVASVMDGYHVCIFAYGQTGSGKTYTMEGPPTDRGVNMRAIEEVLKVSQMRSDEITYEIRMSILEIYNEEVRDLLAPANSAAKQKLEIRRDPNAGNYVQDLSESNISSMEEVESLMGQASAIRSTAATNMNEHSSRSHAIIIVTVEGVSTLTGFRTMGKLNLIDLAGSERTSKTEATGDRLKEAQHINKSLSALGDVISVLHAKNSHIPYRNSKLTYLLQDSLGGESKTLMFVQISPSSVNLSESVCSLNFASRVKCVEQAIGGSKKYDPVELSKLKQLVSKAKEEGKQERETADKLREQLSAVEEKLKRRYKEVENLVGAKLKLQMEGNNKEQTLADMKSKLSESHKHTVQSMEQTQEELARLRERNARLMAALRMCKDKENVDQGLISELLSHNSVGPLLKESPKGPKKFAMALSRGLVNTGDDMPKASTATAAALDLAGPGPGGK